MAGLDLTGIRGIVEDWIVDTISVQRDNGAADDELNDDGDLIPPPREDVYTGDGSILPRPAEGQGEDIDTMTVPIDSETTHRLLLPLSSPADIRKGDLVTCTAVDPTSGDLALVGRWFEVTEVPSVSSFAVLRIAWLKPARPPVDPPVEGP